MPAGQHERFLTEKVIPFDLQRYAAELDLARVDDELVDAWLRELSGLDLTHPGAAYIEDQA